MKQKKESEWEWESKDLFEDFSTKNEMGKEKEEWVCGCDLSWTLRRRSERERNPNGKNDENSKRNLL